MSWHFTSEKIEGRIRELKDAMVRQRQTIGVWKYGKAIEADAVAPGFDDSAWQTLAPKGTYQAAEETMMLRSSVTIPSAFDGLKVYVALEFENAETLVYVDGKPNQAIDYYHHDLLLADKADARHTYVLALAAYTGSQEHFNSLQVMNLQTHADDPIITVTLKTSELRAVDRETEALYYDMKLAYDAALVLDKNSREYLVILDVLDETTNLLDFHAGYESAFYESVGKARHHIQANLYRKYHADPDFAPTLWATGHAHIDTAWLWRLIHTRQKIGRTFTTALTLMEQYPEYHFSCSQPQQYAYLKADYPEVYERLKKAVHRGQWEAVGGMWIESDCNVVSGESLARHFLYGLRFFQKEFGKHTNVVWLPDVFGYSASFPQIIKLAGMKYFMTIKIHWNQVNKPPYQTFEWEGIDGTSVLAHLSPLGDYNALMTPAQWVADWAEYGQKNLSDSALYIYGHGDGGGGPTRQMLEMAQRAKDFPGLPKIKLTTNEAFFEDLEKQVIGKPQLPCWVGELYFERHRGTYTSQARNKKANRQAEILLGTAEQCASLALLLTGAAYPQESINKAWELTLLNQFHDIIPGSSIHAVYEDSDEDYKTILSLGADAAKDALAAIAKNVNTNSGDVVLYNPLSWTRSDVAEAPRALNLAGQHFVDFDGQEKTLIQLKNTPALGYETLVPETLPLMGDGHGDSGLVVTADTLENRFFKMTLDKNGEISSLLDKRINREVIDQTSYCKGNALLSFEDKPINWDAWDIDIYYQDKMVAVQDITERRVLEQGPLRATIEIVRHFGRGSTLTQRISVYRDLPRIDFVTDVDWQERQTLLKVAFPVTVHSNRATYDIQFGNLERPTHWNTTWDWARFEVCGQKWADLSEGDYGVSLLSDCKYGWDIKGNVMRLTLLRGSILPDPLADLGKHRFAYALYPHSGDWRAAQTVQRAYEFNVPVQHAVAPGGGALPSSFSLAAVDAPNLIIETVKKAEDGDSLIVRLHESYGQRGTATLTFARALQSAREVNLLENETAETKTNKTTVSGETLTFTYHPYEIKTFMVRL